MKPKGRWLRFRSFWIFPSLAALLITISRHYTADANFADLVWLMPLGLFLWTFLEYTLHRFVFHMETDGVHTKHHRHPSDSSLILVVPELAILISAVVSASILFLTRNYFFTAGIMTGIWIGFLYYETVHYRVHIGNANHGWIASQRRMHFHHHFRNSKESFGVTTPIWDYIFKTTAES